VGSSGSGGIPGWDPATGSKPPTADRRQPPYRRSIAWAVAVWIVAVAAAYVSQVVGVPQLGGWLGLAGFIVGIWIGGTKGGVRGVREWAALTGILAAIAFLALGLGSCVYAIALYG
jgi:hypothetical protein